MQKLGCRAGSVQIAELCEQGGKPLDVSSSTALSHSLEAAVRAAPDKATAALIKSLVTRAMSEAEYLPAGKALSQPVCRHFWLSHLSSRKHHPC